MAGPEPITPLNEGTSNQNTTKSIIEGHISALKELLKEPNNRYLIKPMLLDFDDVEDVSDDEIKVNMKGKAKVGDEDLSKPFKEVLKCPFTRRIVEFSSPGHRMPSNAKIYDGTGDPEDHMGRFVGMGNQGEWPMPVWCRMFQQSLDGKARTWFDKLPPGSIDNWGDLQRKFLNRFGMLKECDKDPTEISKIVRRANETLPNFKERWVSESNAIPNVPELMQISSFMSSHKCPELSKRFSDNIPKTDDEMLKRVDDYLLSEEAFYVLWEPPPQTRAQTYFQGARASCTIRTAAPSQPGVSPTERNQSGLNPGFIGKYSSRDSSYGTPTTPAATSTIGRSTQPKEENHDDRRKMDERLNNIPVGVGARPLGGGSGSGGQNRRVKPLGKIELDVCFGGSRLCRRVIMKFTIILARSPYNIILGRPGLKQLKAILSTIYRMVKFLTPRGIATLVSQTPIIFECRREGKKQAIEQPEETEPQEKVSLIEQVLVNPAYPEQLVVIGKDLSPEGSMQLKNLLKRNKDIFAWEPADMTGVLKTIINHSLNANPLVTPVSQKRMVFCFEKSRVITKEVAKWLKAGIVRPVKYPTWISNPVLVKKVKGSWRMCIDFKNINAACPKDYYPLPEIDNKIESEMGFPLKCFLDAYKGYHQQQLVDEALQSQIGRNLEVYVDDMVVKSKSEWEMLADIAETFDNLRRINMKLNQKSVHLGSKKESSWDTWSPQKAYKLTQRKPRT
ncbi:reverse transcriptase domain-containing protein [Tanacetum coccineum]|uniref:Reverse transcriptase domain-containing protein n=1 Tax=Tanacetum coccineum TaxID=301880 RepID=A0ABQ4ZY98_9ASTR